jgi:putative ABC transport system permease protein
MSRSRRLRRVALLSIELLAAHRGRTVLSILGMVVGVATVMVMVALGKGAEQRVVERVRAMGTDIVIVTSPPAIRVAGRQRQSERMTALRAGDADAIVERSTLAVAAAAGVQRPLIARWADRNATVPIHGTSVTGLRIRGMRARTGRVFDDDEDRERRRVAMIGPTAAAALFPGVDPVGRELRIGPVPFDVIGVLAPRGTDVGGTDLDYEIVIPLETAMRRVLNVPFVHSIYVQAPSADLLADLEADVREILLALHPTRAGDGGSHSFVVQNQAVLLRTHRGAAQAIGRMTVAVATIALVVGGLGIMAVMLLSVRERAREIGLRRAVGARRHDIRTQFLVEGTAIAGAGAAIGIALGYCVSATISALGDRELVFSWRAALAGLVVSVICGLGAGAWPASRASRVTPLAALRS